MTKAKFLRVTRAPILPMHPPSSYRGQSIDVKSTQHFVGWHPLLEKTLGKSLQGCHAPLHEECLQHHGHKGDPRVKPKTCGVIDERAQVILVWVRPPDIEYASHPWELGVASVRP